MIYPLCILPAYPPVDIKGRGRVKETDSPIEIDGITVESGDLIFVDNEAVCIVPKKIEEKLLHLIDDTIKEEKRIVDLINSGIVISQIIKLVKAF